MSTLVNPSPSNSEDPDPGRKERGWNRLLEVDAWVDSTLFRAAQSLRSGFESYTVFMRRFRVRGVGRWSVELACDGLTFGVIGLIVALAFALPAFDETDQGLRANVDVSVTFLDRYGNEIGKRGILLNDAVPLDELPDHLIKAVLATEDRRFFQHFGIDIPGTVRAMIANMRARSVVQGGSSITQQLAKNLFLTSERTLERKIKEAFLALWLEANLSKREILKLYLDRAYMGGGTFGVAAAAEFYFGKSVKDVSLAESAMLAGLFKAPTKYAPHIDLPAARGRANTVLTNMVESGFMTEGQVIGARRSPAEPVDLSAQYTPDYYLDWAFDEVKPLLKGPDHVFVVRTTLDLNLQKQAEEAVESHLRQFGEGYGVKQAAMVAMETDGSVRAMVGGRDYGASQFNRATGALRQPGSSFKPFVYMTALMNGYSPRSVVRDAPITIGNWSPRNYTRGYRGPVTLTTALTKSINTVPVRLAQAIGRDKIVTTAKAMGLRTEMRITRSLPLGSSEVTVLDMAGSYGTLAAGGGKTVPFAIQQIHTSTGEPLYDRRKVHSGLKRVLPPQKVAELNQMLHNVVENGTGRRARLPGVAAAGKTGTTQAYRDAWFVGYTGNFVAAVWFGNDDYKSTRRLTGGRLPAMTWQKFMSYAHANIDLKALPGVDPSPTEDPSLTASAVASTSGAITELNAQSAQPRILTGPATRVVIEIEKAFRKARPLTSKPGTVQGARLKRSKPGRVTVIGGNRSSAVFSNRHHLERN